jgi:uncharacterized protein (DUF58 family)
VTPETPASLRTGAAALAAPLPPLLAAADHLAATVILGDHGRRRAGLGDDFWQYRPARPQDEARSIDWRRSARSDAAFVQDKEWQTAQSVTLWADRSASMHFTSAPATLPAKADRARLIALALAILLLRGGERVGLADPPLPPARGTPRAGTLAAALCEPADADYGTPPQTGLAQTGLAPHGRAVFLSDFLADPAPLEAALAAAAARGVRGALLQVLDPAEEAFPFSGRTIFDSMAGTLSHDTLRAAGLRDRYRDRLAARKDHLARLASRAGWHYDCHHTDTPPATALLWLWRALEGRP